MIECYRINNINFRLVQLPERAFSIGQTQVTQELWDAVMGVGAATPKAARSRVATARRLTAATTSSASVSPGHLAK